MHFLKMAGSSRYLLRITGAELIIFVSGLESDLGVIFLGTFKKSFSSLLIILYDFIASYKMLLDFRLFSLWKSCEMFWKGS